MKKWILGSLLLLCGIAAYTQPALPANMASALVEDFYQTEVIVSKKFKCCSRDRVPGNCVAIALIKTALAEYGSVQAIFGNYSDHNGTVSLVFRDGVDVTVSPDDIALVKRISGIKPTENARFYEDALLLYAGICRRVLKNPKNYAKRPRCISTFENAVEAINMGYAADSCHELLGLKMKNIWDRQVSTLTAEPALIIRTGAHAAYCSYGVQDIMGDRYTIVNGKMKNPRGPERKIEKAFKITRQAE